MLRSFLIALQFLTRFPLPAFGRPEDRDVGRSLLFYPLIGLLIGAMLVALDGVAAGASEALRAALLLAAWVIVTGGLHLDGLADSADAWVGGLGDRERTLAIMKDPRSGPAAVTTLVVILILKLAALQTLVADGIWPAFLLAPLLGRGVIPLLFLTTPYVRPGGLGAALATHLPRRAATGVVLATALAILVLMGKSGVLSLVAAAAMFLLLRAMMTRRINGTTGDTVGAMVELTETAVLMVIAM